ncbi:MAG: cytochrome c maturation protein CcmE [Candidatus Pacearchaeota archaeon]
MKTQYFFALLSFLLVLILVSSAGCGFVSVKELKENPEKYLGKEIVVSGIVKNSVKIGTLSGFALTDGDYSINVQSKELPEEGKKVTVKGTVMKEIFLGYYIYANKIY